MKRLNVKLLVILFVGVVVLTGAAFGLWMMNTSRTLEALKLEAQRAQEDGDTDKAIDFYGRYIKQVPEDSDAAGEYALLVADWAETPGTPRHATQIAYRELERALRLDSSRDDIRRRLITYTMARRRFADAVENINILLEKNPEDGELLARLAQCYASQKRLDDAREAYAKSIAADPQRVDSYLGYAVLLRSEFDDVAAADELIDSMVETNPDDYRSHLVRCTYFRAYGLMEEAYDNILKAAELAPEEMEVLLTAATIARRTKRVDEARDFLARARDVDGSSQEVFRMLATIAQESNELDLATEYVNEGIEKNPTSRLLLEMKAGLLIADGQLDEARDVIAQLDGLRHDIEKLDFLRAQVLLREGQYVRAAQLLESIRPLLVRDTYNRIRTNLTLITCYERLGQNDLVIDACNRVLADDPQNQVARIRRISSNLRNERWDVANQDADDGTASMAPVAFQTMIGKQLSLPVEQRDWSRAEEHIATIRERTAEIEDPEVRARQEVNLKLYEAEILYHKGELEEAERRLSEARDALPEDASMWVALANFKQRSEGVDAMFAVLDEAEAKLGPQLLLSQKRIQGFQAKRTSEVLPDLLAMESELQEKFSDSTKLVLLSNLAEALFSLGEYEEAQRIFGIVDENSPYPDLRIRMRRFEMAASVANAEDMDEMIGRVAEIVGKESAEWNYAQAMRRVTLVIKGETESDELVKAREHIEKAAESRENWYAVWRVRAQIDRLEGNYESAIDNYERAIELGERQRGYFMDLVRLYSITGQPEKALKYLTQLQHNVPDSVQLARGEMIVRMQAGDAQGAFEAGKDVVATSEDAGDWVQFGQILARLEAEDEAFEYEVSADEAFQKATELAPTDGSIWTTLVQYLVGANRKDEATEVIQEMQGHLTDEQEPLVMGLCYQLVGRGEDAEKALLRAAKERPEELGVLRTLVTFYVQNNNFPMATEYLDKMLAAEKVDTRSDLSNVRWARRSKAQIVARSGNYRDLQSALAMIDENAVDGDLYRSEIMLKSTLLGGRSDYESRSEAIRLMEDLQTRMIEEGLELSPVEKHLLARLYEKDYRPDSWLKCREQMLNLIASVPPEQSQVYKFDFIRMLTDRAESPSDLAQLEVKSWLDALEADGASDMLTEARVRYLAKAGKSEEAVEVMREAIPSVADILPEETQRLLGAANILESLELYDGAEEFLKRYVKAKPEDQLRLAAFHGRRHNLDDALFICEEALDNKSYTEVSGVAQGILRSCVAQIDIDDKYFNRVEGWINKAQDESANPDAVQLTLADFRDAQGRYDEAVKIYEKMLKKDNLYDRGRVTALNNLAFIYAVRDGNGKKAQPMIEEAISIVGPLPELLDTKAMVLLALGDTEQSISILDSALLASPEDSMLYFHKAKAQKSADDMDGFYESMEKAVAAGLNESALPPLEHSSYHDMLKTYELIRAA